MNPTQFSTIANAADLIKYLNSKHRFNGVKALSKYTRLSSVIEMFKSRYLLINNPANMNDLYEYNSFPVKQNWEKICFSSFITQSTESMAMWSMYAQPWNDGVMISIPIDSMRALVDNTRFLYEAKLNEKTKRYCTTTNKISADSILSFGRIVYFDDGVLTCTENDGGNRIISDPYKIPELAGYVKDSAWDYEKEARLRVDLPEEYSSNAIFMELPDEFLSSITIMSGPRFGGNILTALPIEFRPNVKVIVSKYKEKLAWIPCDDCEHK